MNFSFLPVTEKKLPTRNEENDEKCTYLYFCVSHSGASFFYAFDEMMYVYIRVTVASSRFHRLRAQKTKSRAIFFYDRIVRYRSIAIFFLIPILVPITRRVGKYRTLPFLKIPIIVRRRVVAFDALSASVTVR